MRGGAAIYGDSEALLAIAPDPAACETIPGTVCGVEKSVCLQSEIGKGFAAVAAANTGNYDLFFCGVPEGEPTCVPFRAGEYGASTPDDTDGDGVPNAQDDCATIFNPARPVDGGDQADHDSDGLGDVCDPARFSLALSATSTPTTATATAPPTTATTARHLQRRPGRRRR